MAFEAKILADSVSSGEHPRLTTFEVSFPRPFLAEFNTHRQFSRNSASSRAIPVEKMIARVMEDPYIPSSWGKNQKGMQAGEDLPKQEHEVADSIWLRARDVAVERAQTLLKLGVHKQLTNRLLEPFMWHTCIVTATEWSNFFHLRNNPMAQPEIQIIARMMQQLYEGNEPERLDRDEWHLPLIGPEDYDAAFDSDISQVDNDSHTLMKTMAKVSIGRCARVSYLTHDGKRDLKADIALYDTLLQSGHMSPFEHVARPMNLNSEDESNGRIRKRDIPNTHPKNYWFGNLRGWVSYRSTIPNEEDILKGRP